jgi:hypothetical protein
MRVHNINDTRQQLGEEETEVVNEFVYLESIISERGGSDEDTIARIKKRKSCFLTIITHTEVKTNFIKNQNKVI